MMAKFSWSAQQKLESWKLNSIAVLSDGRLRRGNAPQNQLVCPKMHLWDKSLAKVDQKILEISRKHILLEAWTEAGKTYRLHAAVPYHPTL